MFPFRPRSPELVRKTFPAIPKRLKSNTITQAEQSKITKQLDKITGNIDRADKNMDYKITPWEFNDFNKYTLGRRLDPRDNWHVSRLFLVISQ